MKVVKLFQIDQVGIINIGANKTLQSDSVTCQHFAKGAKIPPNYSSFELGVICIIKQTYKDESYEKTRMDIDYNFTNFVY